MDQITYMLEEAIADLVIPCEEEGHFQIQSCAVLLVVELNHLWI